MTFESFDTQNIRNLEIAPRLNVWEGRRMLYAGIQEMGLLQVIVAEKLGRILSSDSPLRHFSLLVLFLEE